MKQSKGPWSQMGLQAPQRCFPNKGCRNELKKVVFLLKLYHNSSPNFLATFYLMHAAGSLGHRPVCSPLILLSPHQRVWTLNYRLPKAVFLPAPVGCETGQITMSAWRPRRTTRWQPPHVGSGLTGHTRGHSQALKTIDTQNIRIRESRVCILVL